MSWQNNTSHSASRFSMKLASLRSAAETAISELSLKRTPLGEERERSLLAVSARTTSEAISEKRERLLTFSCRHTLTFILWIRRCVCATFVLSLIISILEEKDDGAFPKLCTLRAFSLSRKVDRKLFYELSTVGG